MRSVILGAGLFGLIAAGAAGSALAQTPGTYPDGHGGEVFFPLGDRSFADEVISFEAGEPDGGDASAHPQATTGVPDWNDGGGEQALTLGCTGELTLAFTDNRLIDIDGPDLYVFEIGGDTEATALAISENGEEWTRVGVISGGKAEIDIAAYVDPGTSFSQVRLVDLRQACNSRTPGADVDAVGAIGSARSIALDSSVLFDSGEHRLKSGAHDALSAVVATIDDPGRTRIEVAGHTDSVGEAADNQALSQRRAQAVADFLLDSAPFEAADVTTRAFGESRPVADNSTSAGRARNRRVELTVRTTPGEATESHEAVDILGVWDVTDHGIMELRRRGDVVEGEYTLDNGAVFGEFTDPTTFEGYWVEDDSRRGCDTQRDGRDHWGHLKLEFDSPELDRFEAHWRYCGEDAYRDTWDGELRRLL